MDDNSIADQVSLAQAAEQAERYDDMAEIMRKVVLEVKDQGLTDLQRNLLSVAYKNLVGTRRSAWRTISAVVAKDGVNQLATEYLEKIKKELVNICEDVLVSSIVK